MFEGEKNGDAESFRGRAMAIIRAGYEKGKGRLKISAEGLEEADIEISVKKTQIGTKKSAQIID